MSNEDFEYFDDEDLDDMGDLPELLRGGEGTIGLQAVCRGCGCTEDAPCPGGCIWATPDLCSQCARKE